MDPRLSVLTRLQAGLQRHLGVTPEALRMLAEPLYARDVLLVCDAFDGTELPLLAHEYRQADLAYAAAQRAAAATPSRRSDDGRRRADDVPAPQCGALPQPLASGWQSAKRWFGV